MRGEAPLKAKPQRPVDMKVGSSGMERKTSVWCHASKRETGGRHFPTDTCLKVWLLFRKMLNTAFWALNSPFNCYFFWCAKNVEAKQKVKK